MLVIDLRLCLLSYRRGFSLQEALEIAYDDDIEEIFIEPPDAGVLTDADSGDEDGGGLIDNLSGAQLRAQAEVRLLNNDRIGGCSANDQTQESTPPQGQSSPPLQNMHKLEDFEWIRGDLEPNNQNFPAPNYSQYQNMSPVQLFELFIDDDILSLLIRETSTYALFKNCPDPRVSLEEMKCYLGILILTGYNDLPGQRFYWDSDSDMRNHLVYNSMRRDRFLQISRFIHFADNNNPDISDKIWKMRPLMDKVKSKFLEHFQPEEHLCYDESMIKYFGKHSCKQFIRGKPVRFGYKMWCLNTTSGYLVNFEMYQGNNPRRSPEYEKLFGKASAPMITMLDEIGTIKGIQPYKLFFDNLFTGTNLLKYLRDRRYQGTGTVRENRLPRECPLPGKKAFEKHPRGSFDSIIDKGNGILFVRWVDNGVVTLASTCFGLEPMGTVRRYSKAEKRMIQVTRPNVIGTYNSHMGGTDLMDENISRYRIGVRGKKWWWCLFTWMLDACMQNAWQLHKKSKGTLPQLEFRREIVKSYLKSFGTQPKGAGRTSTSTSSVTLNRVSDDLRYDKRDHFVVRIPQNKRRRCTGEGCASSGRTMCNKCNVGLCIDCFCLFHTP
ncbi:hypothetical protein NQ315_003371 [Exocentrus adspersus]|uniref:PiggyBac transposable element-derived protein domain-containing protein n=1 Tax=Exocentrus adspersus TaxID=1586481 RepID=A0AAV8VAA6_9CUCU|nr:hypothetical protein NQ315_003371 [Exocentrus adspersus]